MRNRFNLNEEEKNRIRGLHGISLITEQPEPVEEPTFPDEEGNPRPGDGCDAKNLCDDPNNPGECIECEDVEQGGDEFDDEIIDDEITDEEIVDAPEDEDSWLKERWEDLTDAVRNVFRRSKHFAGCSGPNSCPAWGKVDRKRRRKILRRIRFKFPKIKWPKIKLFSKREWN